MTDSITPVLNPVAEKEPEPSPKSPPAPPEDSNPSMLVSNAPPTETAENPQAPAEPSPYDDQKFQENIQANIKSHSEGWNRDWKLMIEGICEETGLSRAEAMQYLTMIQIGKISGMLQGYQDLYNSDQSHERRAKEAQVLEMERVKLMRQLGIADGKANLIEPVGPGGWKVR